MRQISTSKGWRSINSVDCGLRPNSSETCLPKPTNFPLGNDQDSSDMLFVLTLRILGMLSLRPGRQESFARPRKAPHQLLVSPLVPPGKKAVGVIPFLTASPSHHRRDDLCRSVGPRGNLDDFLEVLVLGADLLTKLLRELHFEGHQFPLQVIHDAETDCPWTANGRSLVVMR